MSESHAELPGRPAASAKEDVRLAVYAVSIRPLSYIEVTIRAQSARFAEEAPTQCLPGRSLRENSPTNTAPRRLMSEEAGAGAGAGLQS